MMRLEMWRGPLALALTALVFGCGEKTATKEAAPAKAQQSLTYDGSTTISGKVLGEVIPLFQQKTGIAFGKVGTSGAGKGLKAALAGEVDLAGVTRSLTAEELAQKPYFQIIGYDALGVFVNDQNPVKALSKAQLKGIFTGKVTNWKELGGRNQPIVACTEVLSSGRATVDGFKSMALDGAAFGTVKELEDPADCLKLVASDPGAVTPATVAYAIPGVRAVTLDGINPLPEDVRSGTYLLSRPMLLVTRSMPVGASKAFFDFMLSPDGQGVIAKRFVPVR
jgi:phosphate transport system substrate-binding protein